ncbi:DNA endonuclease SmrA [Teredinibacter haidensis]|uniref:DNA endonuclease SmrA n=1 Tax=Teredinibacter haidensis TaxID=2731755 RepID=UPI00094900A4|nr:DNA endonuclease SmrA [Teredinibacter haidensis]
MDDDNFSSLLGDDVEPIKLDKRVKLISAKDVGVDKEQRRLSAQELKESKEDPLSAPVDLVEPLAVLTYQRPGVQHGVFKNLRTGKYIIDARLDLHRLTVEQARKNIFQFVQDCMETDVRCALITHGKGEGRKTPALLKSCVAHWLPQFDEVLAFHSAQKQHGSYGATYVLLKKSDKKKLEAKERFARHKP